MPVTTTSCRYIVLVSLASVFGPVSRLNSTFTGSKAVIYVKVHLLKTCVNNCMCSICQLETTLECRLGSRCLSRLDLASFGFFSECKY